MEEELGKYYQQLMPMLQTVLAFCQGGRLTLLRAKTLQCIALVGTATGKEIFRHDAIQLLENLVGTTIHSFF